MDVDLAKNLREMSTYPDHLFHYLFFIVKYPAFGGFSVFFRHSVFIVRVMLELLK